MKDVTGDYVMVTIKASKDFDAKDDKIYYVNKNAWVEIPEVKTEGSSTFVNWTADKAGQNEGQAENGVFDFTKRHKFTENTIISPSDAKDVVEQIDPNKKPDVPNSYVKVIVKTTDKATDATAFEKTFWVNPTKEVTIPVANPTGKTVAADPAKVGAVGYTMNFSKWETEDKAKTWLDKIVGKFENDTTIIAKYSVTPEVVKPQVPSADTVHTPQGKTPTADEIKDKITPPEGKTISKVTIVENPDVNNPGKSTAKVIVEYTDGSSVGTNDKPVEVPVEVHEPIIPAKPDGTKPEGALDNYVKVIFKAGEGGTVSGDLVYYVSPEVEVDMTESAGKITKTPSVGYTSNGGTWSPEIKAEKITAEKTYEFNFVKSEDIVEKTGEDVKKPEGYVTVKFIAGENGEVVGGNKIYYVNPEANIKLVDKDKATEGAKNELIVPEAKANDNYGFTGWVEEIDYDSPIKGDREHVAKFTLGQVTLTYKAGEGATGDVPAPQTAAYGGTVQLAGKGTLMKENSNFIGWKLDDDETIYQPGDSVTLEKARTATAQWSSTTHKVSFNSMGGSDVASQTVEHGKIANKPEAPALEGKVFMGWKEKETDTSYFDFNTAINEDKTLIAQWQDPVQKINDGDPVEEQFIKVTFKQGDHGTLKEGQTEGIEKVTYKVAKDYDFAEAVQAGLVVPGINPTKYYKAVDLNEGWNEPLELNGQDITFTALYEPIADVIPVDPEVTNETQIQNEKPDGMVLVTFKVSDDNKFYLVGNAKYYVKKETEVRIPTPVVLEKTIDAVFNGWKDVTLVNEPLEEAPIPPDAKILQWVKQSFKEDTVISDKQTDEIKLLIKKPFAGDKRIYIKQMSADSTGKLELIRSGNVIETATNKEFTRRGIEFNVFDLTNALQSGDIIRYWQESSFRKSDYTTEFIN